MNQIISVLASVVGGLAISFAIYWGLNFVISKTGKRASVKLLPIVFLGPVFLLLAIFLIAPLITSIWQSFQKFDGFGNPLGFGGFSNYVSLFTTASFLQTLLNQLLWIIFVPAVVVIIGLGVATLADRLGPRREKIFKTMIFLPFAISGVAASTVFFFVYVYYPAGQPQVGLLNAIWVGILHQNPVPWLLNQFLRTNSFLLMAVVAWLNVGYALTLLSAAIKGVPEETIEAARIDGASEQQAFFRVIVPQIRTTIIAVGVTVLITVMKIFDIVFAMTSGQYNTNVLGVEFYNQLFSFNNPGKASAVVVILIVAVIPIIIFQIRTYRQQEALR